jgi:hypothetical protein
MAMAMEMATAMATAMAMAMGTGSGTRTAKVTMMAKATMVAATMVRLLWHRHNPFYPLYLIVIKTTLRITPILN